MFEMDYGILPISDSLHGTARPGDDDPFTDDNDDDADDDANDDANDRGNELKAASPSPPPQQQQQQQQETAKTKPQKKKATKKTPRRKRNAFTDSDDSDGELYVAVENKPKVGVTGSKPPTKKTKASAPLSSSDETGSAESDQDAGVEGTSVADPGDDDGCRWSLAKESVANLMSPKTKKPKKPKVKPKFKRVVKPPIQKKKKKKKKPIKKRGKKAGRPKSKLVCFNCSALVRKAT